MDILRLALFVGMVAHKLLWEVLKRRRSPSEEKRPWRITPLLLIKYGKIGVLIFLAVQTLFLDLFPILREPAALRLVGSIVYFFGLAMAMLGRIQLGDNWANLEDRTILQGQVLVTTGIYRYIRHPIYVGDLLLLVGLELALNSWLVLGTLLIAAVTIRQALDEERVLADAFPGYEQYRYQTKRFIPFIL